MKFAFILGCAIALSACSTTKPLEISTTPVEHRILQPSMPSPVSLNDVKFRVITKDTLDAFIAEQTKLQENSNPVFVVVGIDDYQALSLNLAELRRYIDQQKQIIIYYQSATAPVN